MKRPDKRGLLLFFGVLLFAILFWYFGMPRSTHQEYGSFTPDKAYSWDNAYYALQEVEEAAGDDANLIRVSVYEADTGHMIFSFYPARARDFWGICWENDSYNIWTQSADIGILCYRYDNMQWIPDESAQRPPYILSKYD